MTSRAWWAAVAACIVPLLHACGGGSNSDGGAGAVRLVNATLDYPSLDLYSTDTSLSTGIVSDAAGSYVSLGASTYTFALKRNGTSTTSNSSSRTVAGGVSYTLVAYSTGESLRSAFLEESEAAPTSGSAKLRIFNASIEAGALDVYVTAPDALLTDSSPASQALGTERVSSFVQWTAGTYRIRVTGSGDKTDLRLDIPSITLSDQQIATLVLTSTPGGVLVHGVTILQKGAVGGQRNTSARVRLVASAASTGTVAATVNGTVLSAGLRSPAVGNYALVDAGSAAMTVSINGTAVAAPSTTLTAGADTTLLVTGTAGAPAVTLLSDDNRPAFSAANTKLRLVHGVSGLLSPITLTADYAAVASDVALNSASTPVSTAASTTFRLEASSPASATALYLATDVTLQAGRVYTLFMLGDSGTPLGVLRRDR